LARGAVVESSVFRGRVVEVYRFVADLGAYGLKVEGATVDVGIPGYGMEVHTYVKDVGAALLVALGKVSPSSPPRSLCLCPATRARLSRCPAA